jgi:hypothetical protein
MNIVQCLDDPKVFGRYFKAETWNVWRVFLAALFGLPLTPGQLALIQQFTGRKVAPSAPTQEAWVIAGRRAGKSFALATVAAFLGTFRDCDHGGLRRIEQHQKGEEDFRTTLESLISLASRAPELFERSKPEQKRQLLVFVFSNLQLSGKKLEFSLILPST